MSRKKRIVAAALAVGGEEKAQSVSDALKFYSERELFDSTVETLLIEAGFDCSLPEVMGLVRCKMSPELREHYAMVFGSGE